MWPSIIIREIGKSIKNSKKQKKQSLSHIWDPVQNMTLLLIWKRQISAFQIIYLHFAPLFLYFWYFSIGLFYSEQTLKSLHKSHFQFSFLFYDGLWDVYDCEVICDHFHTIGVIICCRGLSLALLAVCDFWLNPLNATALIRVTGKVDLGRVVIIIP